VTLVCASALNVWLAISSFSMDRSVQEKLFWFKELAKR
jgi:hypothetical protein